MESMSKALRKLPARKWFFSGRVILKCDETQGSNGQILVFEEHYDVESQLVRPSLSHKTNRVDFDGHGSCQSQDTVLDSDGIAYKMKTLTNLGRQDHMFGGSKQAAEHCWVKDMKSIGRLM